MDDTDEVGYSVIRGSDGLLTIGPCGDRLANHFRGGKTLAASQTRDALPSFGVNPKSEWRGHDGVSLGLSVTRFVIQGENEETVQRREGAG